MLINRADRVDLRFDRLVLGSIIQKLQLAVKKRKARYKSKQRIDRLLSDLYSICINRPSIFQQIETHLM